MLLDRHAKRDPEEMGFEQRVQPADLPELMDEPCTYEEFRACLHDLGKVNRCTRAYTPTLEFLDRLSERLLPQPLRILDVGAGGGDMLRHVAQWARESNIPVELTGIDLNPYAARAAREFSEHDPGAANIRWITADAFGYEPREGVDIVLSSLFAHHLSSPDVVRFLAWMEKTARVGWFVNDLQRSERAARWFRLLPVILRWHRFVRHDGPVSLQRAFREADWQWMLAAAGIPVDAATLESYPMARLCVSRLR
jgi:SAM-dependent methyltransferase